MQHGSHKTSREFLDALILARSFLILFYWGNCVCVLIRLCSAGGCIIVDDPNKINRMNTASLAWLCASPQIHVKSLKTVFLNEGLQCFETRQFIIFWCMSGFSFLFTNAFASTFITLCLPCVKKCFLLVFE